MSSFYELVGGDKAMEKAVNVFYRKVLKDQNIKHFFNDIDMTKQMQKQKAFFTLLFDGPNNYTGKDLKSGHAHLVARGLNDSHFDAVLAHLQSTFVDLSIPDEIANALSAKAEAARDLVLGK
ncbi:group I truncated hemoglobin [Fluviispira sanaruensis]|uniref:Group 1 truncated hemoglobin n=1 Tax=Fluviispira sanaruensis TaxID=2493639 RepID=A0A4P2VPS6_FLUSA|nr:group 1 truncated hemoglobin [Fluviispira sanaruensis]BBH54260.1 group 1 truncated hemoglobin [Fluviispira sanaruensis]